MNRGNEHIRKFQYLHTFFVTGTGGDTGLRTALNGSNPPRVAIMFPREIHLTKEVSRLLFNLRRSPFSPNSRCFNLVGKLASSTDFKSMPLTNNELIFSPVQIYTQLSLLFKDVICLNLFDNLF